MSSLLFSAIAATILATAGFGAPAEIRSAQALPVEHMAAAHQPATAPSQFHGVNRLADSAPENAESDQTNKSKCERDGGRWDADSHHRKCKRAGLFWWNNVAVDLIGAGTLGGFIYALTSGDGFDHHSVSN